MSVEDYINGMININHINGLTFKEYRLDEFVSLNDIKVLNFSRSYEGENLLTENILRELQHIPKENLIAHGFELVFQVR